MAETGRVRPFSCGSQAADWRNINCERCARGAGPYETAQCDVSQAVDAAWGGDGTVSADVARRMRADDPDCNHYLTWLCGEYEPTKAWAARHADARREAEECMAAGVSALALGPVAGERATTLTTQYHRARRLGVTVPAEVEAWICRDENECHGSPNGPNGD